MIIAEDVAEPGIPVAGFVVGWLFAAAIIVHGLVLVTDFRGVRTRLADRWTALLDRSRLTGNPVPLLAPLFARHGIAYGVASLAAGAVMVVFLVLMALYPVVQ
ncbi:MULTISPECIES: hypothetical protein [unclassified Kitasatospora]|uniref:hypothetical protein n=1 Tax=unclassified Kitasatospora TaxID=2633591 RepID=UPI00380C6C3C